MSDISIQSYVDEMSEAGKFFIKMLRTYTLDTQAHNELLNEEESSQDSMILATLLTLSDYDSAPPLLSSSVSIDKLIRMGLLSPCLKAAASHLLIMKAQNQDRNRLDYSDGRKTESINDKGPIYKDMAAVLHGEAMATFANFKLSLNMKSSYSGSSGISSDYAKIVI